MREGIEWARREKRKTFFEHSDLRLSYWWGQLFKCVNSERDLFYVDNTRQVRVVLSGHAKQEGMVVEQIGRSSGSYYS